MYGEAKLIVGVFYKDIYSCEDIFEEITKYNENTGEPYLKKVYKESIQKFGDITFRGKGFYDSIKDYFKTLGLVIKPSEYIGIEITELDEWDSWIGDLEQIEEAKVKLQAILDSLGWDLPIKLIMTTCYL
jgi:hypothetical protein